jgi:phenylacetate-coenzyme A ligase PaaK-like adenylate-forming protein
VDELQVPNIEKLSAVQALCDRELPYANFEGRDELFIEGMKQSLQWHRDQNPFYEKFLTSQNYNPEQIKELSDLEKFPYLLANFFKKYEVPTACEEDVVLHLTSSGTSGQKSQMFFDEWSIKSAQRMVDWIFNHYQWITPEQPVNYLLYTYEPELDSKLGTAYTDNFLCGYAPVNKVVYALKNSGSGHKFDAFGVIKALQEFAEEGLPVRIFGFPSFFYFTLEQMQKLKLEPLKLNPESLTFFGGGWKGQQDKAILKEDLYQLAEEMLGIPNERLRDGFGSVEHCIPYVECQNHNFHIPQYSEVIIRDVKTLKALPFGEVGYLNFISPYITSVPANNVLMGDLASLHTSEECNCGNPSKFFKIIGRAGLTKNKSCAISAAELLKEFQ